MSRKRSGEERRHRKVGAGGMENKLKMDSLRLGHVKKNQKEA
jgi:hypothetical protein